MKRIRKTTIHVIIILGMISCTEAHLITSENNTQLSIIEGEDLETRNKLRHKGRREGREKRKNLRHKGRTEGQKLSREINNNKHQ